MRSGERHLKTGLDIASQVQLGARGCNGTAPGATRRPESQQGGPVPDTPVCCIVVQPPRRTASAQRALTQLEPGAARSRRHFQVVPRPVGTDEPTLRLAKDGLPPHQKIGLSPSSPAVCAGRGEKLRRCLRVPTPVLESLEAPRRSRQGGVDDSGGHLAP
jgi:hypothetical protein